MSASILVVDDDRLIRKSLMRVLSKYDVQEAASASEALEQLKTQSFDAIISDYNMGQPNGLEFLQSVRIQYPDTVRILLTGAATLEVAMRALNEKAVDRILVKPFNNVDLAGTIDLLLRGRGIGAGPS